MPSLMAVLGLDKTQFTAGLNSAKGEAQTMGAKIGGALSSAIGGVLTLGGISMAFNSVLQKVGEIRNEAAQTGFDTNSIQKFNFQLRQMNIDVQAGQTGLGKMNELIGQAAVGEEKAVKVFARWGISTEGKTNAEIFAEIQQSIAATTDPAMRVAEAMEIFGRGGRELLPLLTASKEDLDGMAAHAPIISEDDLTNIQKAKNTLEEMKDTLIVMGAKGISGVAGGATLLGSTQDGRFLKTETGLGGGGEDTLVDAAPKITEAMRKANREKKTGAEAKQNGPGSLSFMQSLMRNPPSEREGKQIIFEALYGNLLKGISLPGKETKPEPKRESPGEAHRISRMMDLNSMQKIGAYAQAPPGYMEMVRASLQTERHLASIDKKIITQGTAPTRF